MSNIRQFLAAEQVSVRFRGCKDWILRDVSLAVNPGELIGIIGLSGSGKSTLLKVLNGTIPKHLDAEIEGTVILKDQAITGHEPVMLAQTIGSVFQDPDDQILFACVEDEIAFGPENLCLAPEVIMQRITDICDFLGITDLRLRNPNKLSGGEKQLVVIASVLSLDVDILFFDECMSQVDRAGKDLLLERIKILKDSGKTIIMVDHDLANLVHADRIYQIQQGRLELFCGDHHE